MYIFIPRKLVIFSHILEIFQHIKIKKKQRLLLENPECEGII